MHTLRKCGMNFTPDFTPLGVPVLTCFWVRGRAFVVDIDGVLYQINSDDPDPEMWSWYLRMEEL